MADIYSTKKRSEIMSRVRPFGNATTELRAISLFKANAITGWRRRQSLPGRPDFVFRRSRLALFIDGCFWHGCPEHCVIPATNRAFWSEKLARNTARDLSVCEKLTAAGWKVLRVWEHELRPHSAPLIVRKIQDELAVAARSDCGLQADAIPP